MEHKFIAWTDADYKAIANDKNVQDSYGLSSADELELMLRDEYTIKIDRYITDGPGYSGELWVVVHGIPSATVFGRRKDGTFFINDN